MFVSRKEIVLFCGRSNIELANEIAEKIGLPLSNVTTVKCSNSEVFVGINDGINGSDVYIIQSFSNPMNDSIMELLLLIDAARRASAGRISAVIPYYGYGYYDDVVGPRDVIGARMLADILQLSGVDRILTMELAYTQIQGFFSIPVYNLPGTQMISEYFKDYSNKAVIVPTSFRNMERAYRIAEKLGADIAVIVEYTPRRTNICNIINVVGEIKDKEIILVDDAINDIYLVINLSNVLFEMGAAKVAVCCTHLLLSNEQYLLLEKSKIHELVALNTIEVSKSTLFSKVRILSAAGLFAEAIERIYENISLDTILKE